MILLWFGFGERGFVTETSTLYKGIFKMLSFSLFQSLKFDKLKVEIEN